MITLFTCVPGFGHLLPLLPLANALVAAGHDVAIATGADLRPQAEAAGFTAFSAGIGVSEAFQQLAQRFPDRIFDRLAPAEILHWYLRHLFGETIAPAMLADLEDVVGTWRPDVIVHDTMELAGPIAAASIGVPGISHTLGLRVEGALLECVAAAVAPLWHQHGRAADPTAGVYRHLCLDIMPASMQTATASPRADVIRALRPTAPPPAHGEHLPTWMATRGQVPLVYMTLGTMTNSDVSVFRNVVDGLADVDVEVLVTVGPGNDPGSIGRLPGNVHVEPYVPQWRLLPECGLVICHGGAGTTLGALAHGLPLLVLPQGADQYVICERVVASGAGLRLLPAEVDPASVRSAVVEILEGVEHRAAARRVQQEIGAMPGPEQTVALIEEYQRAANSAQLAGTSLRVSEGAAAAVLG